MHTLEELLRNTLKTTATGEKYHPNFRIAVQSIPGASFVKIIVHAVDIDSETLGFTVVGNELSPHGHYPFMSRIGISCS